MTSLQRAVAAATSAENTAKASFKTGGGQFENSFAAGLDLSEFGSTSSSTQPRICAAEQLLQVKKQERLQREENAKEDRRMEEIVQRRIAGIENTLRRTKAANDSNVVVNALVQMHGTDTDDLRVNRKTKKMMKKARAQQRAANSPAPSIRSGSKVHKKSRRSKY